MNKKEITHTIETTSNEKALYEILVAQINELINNNYSQLLQLLYTIDVPEKKLKEKLKDNPEKDAAIIITDLILERQAQKKESFSSNTWKGEIPEEDKW